MENLDRKELEKTIIKINKKYNKLKKKYIKLNHKYNEISYKNWKVGEKLKYIPTDENVILLKTHFDDQPPYFTIKMPNNREKQTTLDKLLKK